MRRQMYGYAEVLVADGNEHLRNLVGWLCVFQSAATLRRLARAAVVSTAPASARKVNRKDAPMLGNVELAAAAKSSGFNPTTLILILIVVVAFYMLMIRPQQRRKQQAQQQQNTLGVGARVRTTAGMYATVVEVDGDDVILEVAPGVEVRYMRRAVMDVVSPGDAPEEDFVQDEETDADDVDAEDTTVIHDEAEPEVADEPVSDESAYEQATGSKQD
jgi:preprotein translocase subunit YajC